jgi:hypothetical protein
MMVVADSAGAAAAEAAAGVMAETEWWQVSRVMTPFSISLVIKDLKSLSKCFAGASHCLDRLCC